MSRLPRVIARKLGGDDAYSWAIIVDGRPRLTGLHRSEVAHYKEIERVRLGISIATPRAAPSAAKAQS